MSPLAAGAMQKMLGQLNASDASVPVNYSLPLSNSLDGNASDEGQSEPLALNPYLGQSVSLRFLGKIHCTHCGRKTNKSFSQGYCYPCFKSLARCDLCMMSPEKCHYDAGTCREPEWADQFCMSDHIVYLANSSAPKVGITRISQVPTRWIDQGAVQALPIFRVKTRQQSGLVEDCLREHIADKTNWRNMLKGVEHDVDLVVLAQELKDKCQTGLSALEDRFGLQAITAIDGGIDGSALQDIVYPVLEYPEKIKTHNFDKEPLVEGTLLGIKGQYLILDTGVINIRKFTAYHVEFSA